MLRVVSDNVSIGVCGNPQRSGPTWFEAAHVLFDDEAVKRATFRMPVTRTNGFFDQDAFDLVGDDGAVRYTGCTFYSYTAFRHEGGGSVLFENVCIRHEEVA